MKSKVNAQTNKPIAVSDMIPGKLYLFKYSCAKHIVLGLLTRILDEKSVMKSVFVPLNVDAATDNGFACSDSPSFGWTSIKDAAGHFYPFTGVLTLEQ